jgi:hypothetical protein
MQCLQSLSRLDRGSMEEAVPPSSARVWPLIVDACAAHMMWGFGDRARPFQETGDLLGSLKHQFPPALSSGRRLP